MCETESQLSQASLGLSPGMCWHIKFMWGWGLNQSDGVSCLLSKHCQYWITSPAPYSPANLVYLCLSFSLQNRCVENRTSRIIVHVSTPVSTSLVVQHWGHNVSSALNPSPKKKMWMLVCATFLIFASFPMYVCMGMNVLWVQAPEEAKGECWISWCWRLWNKRPWMVWCECWDLNVGPLKKQHELLTSEPPLQLLFSLEEHKTKIFLSFALQYRNLLSFFN